MRSELSRHIYLLVSSLEYEGDVLNVKRLKEIDKYFTDEKNKAFLIGRLLQNHKVSLENNNMNLKPIIDYFKNNGLIDYFQGNKEAINSEQFGYNWVILLFAFLLLVLGFVRIFGNFVQRGLHTKYNTPIIIEGGTPLIFGIILLLVAISRYRYAARRRQVVSELLSI